MSYIEDISEENQAIVRERISRLEELKIYIDNHCHDLHSDIYGDILNELEYYQSYLDRVHEILYRIENDK